MVKTRLKQARTAAGLTLRQAAKALHIHHATYQKYEVGEYYPGEERRAALAALFKASEDKLWPEGHGSRTATPLHNAPLPRYRSYSTAESIQRMAHVQVGEQLLRRLSAVHGRMETVRCTVAETGEHFFTVRWENSGARECFAYQEMFAQNPDIRRGNR